MAMICGRPSAPPFDDLDPGIVDTVRLLYHAGIETTDSGDGVSKDDEAYAAGDALPFPHVICRTTAATMLADAYRVAAILGDGWTVEASFQTHTRSAILIARALEAGERC